MVPGTQALSDHCRQAVVTACLVTLGSLQEPRRHVCLPPAPGADWAQPKCGQVTDLENENTSEVSYLKRSELAKDSQLFREIKLHRMSFSLLVNNMLSLFTQGCACVRQREIISLFVQGISFTPVTASSSQTSTGEGCRHWWGIKYYQSTPNVYLCKPATPNCFVDCTVLVKERMPNTQ